MATKTANLYARIEPDLKEQAESILSILGITALRPVDVAEFTEEKLNEELNEELEKGYADMVSGRAKPAKQVFADIRKDYGA